MVLFLASHKDVGKTKSGDPDSLLNNEEGNAGGGAGDEEEEEGDGLMSSEDRSNQYNRRRSRAVLYQLSGHYRRGTSVTVKSKLKLNNVSGFHDEFTDLLLFNGLLLSSSCEHDTLT